MEGMIKTIKIVFNKHRVKINNFFWLFIEKFFLLIAEFFIVALVARHLGVESYGVLTFIIAMVAILSPFTIFGLSGVLVRYFIDPKEYNRDEIILNAVAIRLTASVAIILIVVSYSFYVKMDDTIKLFLISLVFCEIFKSFTVFNSWFEANLLSRFTAKVKIHTTIFSAVLKLLAVYLELDWESFVIIQCVETLLYSCLIIVVYYYRTGKSFNITGLKLNLILELTKKGLPLLISSIGAVVYLKSDLVMISYFMSDSDVGIYAASARVSELGFVVPTIVMVSIFPSMMRLQKESLLCRKFNRKILSILFYFGSILSVILSFSSELLILTLFGSDFKESINVLEIHCLCLPLVFMRAYVSKWIIVKELYFLSMITQISGAFVNVILNTIWIPKYGVIGAAYATIISFLISSFGSLLLHRSSRSFAIDMIMSPFYYISVFKHDKKFS
jgi:O-antigen/teichoic acid export membrane protein